MRRAFVFCENHEMDENNENKRKAVKSFVACLWKQILIC